MKRFLCGLISLGMVFTLAACGTNTSTSSSSTTPPSSEVTSGDSSGLQYNKDAKLRFLAPANDQQIESYNKVFEEIKENYGITIVGEYVKTWDDFNQKLMTQLAAKTAPDIIDVSVIYRDEFIKNEYLADVMPYATESNFDFTKYYESNFEGLKTDGKLYGMPNGTTSIAVFYNKKLFDEANIPYPGSDWHNAPTWDEFRELSKKLTKGTGATKQYGFATTYDIGWLLPLFWQNNGNFVNADGTKSTVNTPEGIETLKFVNDMMYVDGSSPSLSSLKTMSGSEMFKTGKVAMLMEGNWWMGDFASIDTFEWGVTTLPRNKSVKTGFYIDSWSVTAQSKYPKEAYMAIEYMVSTDGLDNNIAKGIPPMISMAEEQINEIYSFVDDSSRQAWANGISIGRTPTYTKNWAQIVAEANKSLERIALGEITPEQAAAEMEKSTNMLLS